jgi:tetratricopeptide (TPR) repeat protein
MPHTEPDLGQPHQPMTRPPSQSAAREASQAALAANEAYRAGDLDQARQLIDQAFELDPSRAALWQQHRTEIAAKQIFLQARGAAAEGDYRRAEKLINDACQLDPRMQTLWNRHLTATQVIDHDQHTPVPLGDDGERPVKVLIRQQVQGSGAVGRAAPQWPGGPAYRTPSSSAGPAVQSHSHLDATSAQHLGADVHEGRIEESDLPQRGVEMSDHTRTMVEPDSPGRGAPTVQSISHYRGTQQLEFSEQDADWRDAMAQRERQAWQPKVVQPNEANIPPPKTKEPEVGE